MNNLDFKNWLLEESFLDKGIDYAVDYSKNFADRLDGFRKKTKNNRSKIVVNKWENTQKTISSIHTNLINQVQSIDLNTKSPLINHLIKILKIASKIIGFDKITNALAIKAPKTLVKPFKTILDAALTNETDYKDIAYSIINFIKLTPALAMTGVFKLLLPWQMQWFNWTFEQSVKYNVVLTYGLYFLFILAMAVNKNKWFHWFHRIVLSIFPDEFKESTLIYL